MLEHFIVFLLTLITTDRQFWCFSEVLEKTRYPRWRIQDGRRLRT